MDWTKLIYILAFISMGHCVTITPIDNGQGLFFVKTGNAQLIKGECKLIVFNDISIFRENMLACNTYINTLENICKLFNSDCDFYTLPLRTSLKLLRTQLNETKYSGDLDVELAEQYQTYFNLIPVDEKNLGALWNNQTSIFQAEKNKLKTFDELFKIQHKIIQQHFTNLEDVMQKKLSNAESTNSLSVAAKAINNFINYLKAMQYTINEITTNIYKEKNIIQIIDLRQLQRQLNIISGQVAPDVTLPIESVQTGLRNICHLLKIKTRFTEQHMILEISIPLTSRDRYDLYNVIPIPYCLKGNMISMVPIETHVAINLQNFEYFPINEKEFGQCNLTDTSRYTCYLETPVKKMHNAKDLCVRDENQEQQCKTIEAGCQSSWKKLLKSNQYFSFCCKECQFPLDCNGQLTEKILNGPNVISIEENCVATIGNLTINTHDSTDSAVSSALEIDPINNIINIRHKNYGNTERTSGNSEVNYIISILGFIIIIIIIISGFVYWRKQRRA